MKGQRMWSGQFWSGLDLNVLTLFGRLGDVLKLVAAELLAGLGLQDVSVLRSSFVQSLVSILVVHQSAAPPVQQVLQRSHDHTNEHSTPRVFLHPMNTP